MSHFLRTQAIYTYIVQRYEQNSLPPTMREIAQACDLPLTTIFRHLDWLEARGYVQRNYTSRSIRPLKPLLSDEEQIYAGLVRIFKRTSFSPSLKALSKLCGLSLARVKAALRALEQAGRIECDPDDPSLFYPV